MGKYEDRTDAIVRSDSRSATAERRIGPAGGGLGRCSAGLLVLLVVTGFASAAAAVPNDDGGVPDPSAPTVPVGYRENACSPQQIEGGYEDLGGRCQLTGWNWVLPDGTCYASRGAENGRLPAAGDTTACQPAGCVSSICGDNIAPWLGAGQRTPPETCVESASDPADRAIFPKEFLRNLTAGEVEDLCFANGACLAELGPQDVAGLPFNRMDCTLGDGRRLECFSELNSDGTEPEDDLYSCSEIVTASQESGRLVASRWQEDFFPETWVKRTGDVDGDGRDDLVAFVQRTAGSALVGDVYVARSNGEDGFGPPELWHDRFCEVEGCHVGDFDGDGRADAASVNRSGWIRVALSTGTSFETTSGYWWLDSRNGGAYVGEEIHVADMDGDGLDDLAFFRNSTGDAAKELHVIVSTGAGFERTPARSNLLGGCISEICLSGNCVCEEKPKPDTLVWARDFCRDGERCYVGNVTGGSNPDVVAFDPFRHVIRSRWCYYQRRSEWQRYYCPAVDDEVPSREYDDYLLADLDADGISEYLGVQSSDEVQARPQLDPDRDATVMAMPEGAWQTGFRCANRGSPLLPPVCTFADVNGDGLPDLVEFSQLAGHRGTVGDVWVTLRPVSDRDDDGWPDLQDNCPFHANPDQADEDGDGDGDACDHECADGVDNDGDGLVDDQDDACHDATGTSESVLPACSDNIDNDGDGLVDMHDPGCLVPTFWTETLQCDDGIDNDGDGLLDFEDPGCALDVSIWESPACGFGFELVFALPALAAWRSRVRRRA